MQLDGPSHPSEFRHRLSCWLDHGKLWVLLLAAATVLVHPWGDVSWSLEHPTLVWIWQHRPPSLYLFLWILFLTWAGFAGMDRSLGTKLGRLGSVDSGSLGRYTAAEIQGMVDDLIQRLGRTRSEQPKIFVVRSPEANAMSVNFYFLNRLDRRNAIYINSYLLRVLDREELAALLGHELAHFYFYQSPLLRAPFFTLPAVQVLVVGALWWSVGQDGALWSTPWVFGWLGTFFLFQPLVFYVFTRVQAHGLRHSRLEERLADHMGARLGGPLAMINALLKIGTREDVVAVAVDEAKKILSKESDAGSDEDDIMALVRERLPDRPLTPEEALAAVTQGEKRRLSRRERKRLRDILDWREFDTLVPDQKLDLEELRSFVTAVRASDDTELFSGPGEKLRRNPRATHPPIKERVFALVDSFDLVVG